MSRAAALTSQDVAPGATLLVPLGATEQHGPHLPLGTDSVIAERWADGVARVLSDAGQPVVVAPALPYGSSGEHQSFPGTLSIGHEALGLVIIELVRSAATGFARVVFLSGHAGNHEPVTAAVNKMVGEGHDVCCFFPAWTATEHRPIDAHAGRTETSLMLYLEPEQVVSERLAPGDTRPLSEVMPMLVTDGVAAVSPSGVLGDPTGADAAEGRALFEDLVRRTARRLLDTANVT